MSFDNFSSAASVPPGEYTGTLVASRIVQAGRTKTLGLTLYWEVRVRNWTSRVWRTLWFSPAARPRSIRELIRLGVDSPDALDRDPPVPPGAVCRLVIADIRDSGGCIERSVWRWDVLSLPPTPPSGEESVL